MREMIVVEGAMESRISAMSVDAVLEAAAEGYSSYLSDTDGFDSVVDDSLARENARKLIVICRVINDLDGSASLTKDSRVLDVGSGRGRFGIILAELTKCTVVGVDDFGDPTYDFDAIQSASRSHGMELVKSNILAESLPFEDESFDFVTSVATFEHLPESPSEVMKEIYRVLKPGGTFVLGLPNLLALYKRIKMLSGRTCLPEFDGWWNSRPWRGHVREAAPGEVRKILEYSNFNAGREVGIDLELPERLPTPAYLLYRVLGACVPREAADAIFCGGVKQ